jgi:microcompartment protein CcmL/EutN
VNDIGDEALGILEIPSWSVGMVATDAMAKAAGVRLIQSELNDMMGVVVKIASPDTAAVKAAIDAGVAMSRRLGVEAQMAIIPAPGDRAGTSWRGKPEFSPLIEQDVVHEPSSTTVATTTKAHTMANTGTNGDAIGFLETQGFTAVIEAVDAACKAANVEIVGREKLGGGYISVVIRGDVAAVKAAVDAGKTRIEQLGLGKLIAAHVIARPTAALAGLLPK